MTNMLSFTRGKIQNDLTIGHILWVVIEEASFINCV